MSKRAIVIGSGIGGLSMALRLQSLGLETTVLERLDAPGGRAYVRKVDGFTFDMGPTVITVPHFIEELFALEPGKSGLQEDDFPAAVRNPGPLKRTGLTGGPQTSRYCEIVPITPFYRIFFADGTWFDYDGDPVNTREQIRRLAPEDLEGYERFHDAAGAIFERGFLELGYTTFLDVSTMLKILPDLLALDAVRNLFSFASKYFKSDKLRQIFSFETLLVGGSPLRVPAIYAMIHFVEKSWGIHFVRGGTGALVNAFVRKFEDMGGRIRFGAGVEEVLVEGKGGRALESGLLRSSKGRVKGVRLENGEVLEADIVVSNGDVTNTYRKLVPKRARLWNSELRLKTLKQSMSLVVIYFGFRVDAATQNLQHHNIILGPRYEGLLEDIFVNHVLPKDFSQYLHLPTLTDPSLAPPGHHAAYTLIPVPNNESGIDWSVKGPELVNRVLRFLEDEGYIPGLSEKLVHKSFVTPDYFETTLDSAQGNAFGVEPLLRQSAYFRPHNRSEDVEGLYLVGAGTQPGAGTPSVMMSAKMTARLVAKDCGLI
ncbi:MAG: phytoene desaturase [Silvanigrellales bacterium]|nr:phytoene desaturase [Silvanigrellales bacterium]